MGGRDRTALAEGVARQADHVRATLERGTPGGVPVHGALCFVEPDVALLARPFTVAGVLVPCPRALLRVLSEPGPYGGDARARLHRLLATSFPPA